MIISTIQATDNVSNNDLLKFNIQKTSRTIVKTKSVPALDTREKALFANIEKSNQKMTQKDLMALMEIDKSAVKIH